MKKLMAVIPVLFLLSGCSKTPMEKLQSDHIYSDMNEKFWMEIYKKPDHSFWNQAAEYCMGHADKPNCDPVNKIFECGGDCNKKTPPIGHSGESVHIEG